MVHGIQLELDLYLEALEWYGESITAIYEVYTEVPYPGTGTGTTRYMYTIISGGIRYHLVYTWWFTVQYLFTVVYTPVEASIWGSGT